MSTLVRPITRLSCIGVACFVVGCYSLQPTGSATPPLGTTIGLDINDAGRVALGGSMGPAIARIEGRLVSKESTEYVVAVTDVHLLEGGDQVWSGETVHIKSEYVSSILERRLSVARSVALGVAGIGAVAILAGTSLTGFGSTDRPGPSGDTSAAQRIPQRIPRP